MSSSTEIQVPESFFERLQKAKGGKFPNPQQADLFSREYHEKTKEKFAWGAPYDARFPQVRKQRQCFAYYVDAHRCKELMGADYKPCKFFENVYKDVLPEVLGDQVGRAGGGRPLSGQV
ncbi:Cytochrome c oxidase subunit 6B1 [Aphelenchoides fujianensis]|nr:Cytochrome c oxidase subunit 6B1 [Aphelenchoides fujianensis]